MSFGSGWKRMSKIFLSESSPNYYKEDKITEDINQAKLEELLVYNFDILANATENFHLSSKLGQGGFGPVYKVRICLIECLIIVFKKRYLSM